MYICFPGRRMLHCLEQRICRHVGYQSRIKCIHFLLNMNLNALVYCRVLPLVLLS